MFLIVALLTNVSSVDVCCEKTQIGELCAWTNSNECLTSPFRSSPNTCDQTTFCKMGWCIDENEGTCTPEIPSSKCSGEWSQVYNAEKCDEGCCTLGSNVRYVTPGTCAKLAISQGFDPDESFNRGTPKEACRVLTQDYGACSLEDGQCISSTEEGCLGPNGAHGIDFDKNVLCSTLKPSEYVKHSKKICSIEDRNVYWADDKGNREDLFKDCDDVKEACDTDASGNAYCKSLNCMYKGDVKSNGESWCEYDSYVGDSRDAVGSSHWLLNCDNGKVEKNICGGDYRDSICAEKILQDGSSQAQCRKNLGAECFKLKDETECGNTEDCKWQKVDVTKGGDDSFKFGACVPAYPKGFNILTGETESPGESAETICGLATQTCTMVEQKGWDLGWDCIINCECKKRPFVEQMNNFCTSLGDCGAYVNYVGNGTNSYNVKGKSYMTWESTCIQEDVCNYQCTKNEINLAMNPVPPQCPSGHTCETKTECDSFNNCKDFFYDCDGTGPASRTPSLGFFSQFQCLIRGVCRDGKYLLGGKVNWQEYLPFLTKSNVIGQNTPEHMNIERTVGGYGDEINLDGNLAPDYRNLNSWWEIGFSGQFEITDLISFGFSRFFFKPIAGIGKTRERTVTFECLPWKPPVGGASCELCNADPERPCTDYRCQSLGTACETASPVAGYEPQDKVCLDSCRNSGDSAFPEISLNSINSAYSFTPTARGAEIKMKNTGECVQEFSKINLSLKTNELADCKWDTRPMGYVEEWGNTPNIGFDEGAYLSFTHNISLRPQGENNFRMFIRCIDRCGLHNTDEYIVDICLSPQPDTTEPEIESFDPANGGSIKYGESSVNATIYTTEPAECRYSSSVAQPFDTMIGIMSCNNELDPEDFYIDEWFCDANINGLTQLENRIYIKCNDSYGNVNANDRLYILKQTTNPLVITPITPQNGAVRERGVTKLDPLSLKIQTSGGAEGGNAICWNNFRSSELSWIDRFTTTGGTTHEYKYTNMPDDTYNIIFTCEDSVRNTAETTILFTMNVDRQAPIILNKTLQGTDMILTTDEDAECVYNTTSCNYLYESSSAVDISFGRTTTHEINDFNKRLDYYIRCRDEFTNENCTTIEATEQRESNPPEVVRIFYDEKVSRKLKLITNEPAQCSFEKATCSFEVDAGEEMSRLGNKEYSTEHYAPWDLNTKYHIKCIDSWGNPNVGCLIVVEPFRIINLEG